MSALARQARSLRIVRAVFLASIGIYACVGEVMVQGGHEVDIHLEIGIAVCAVLDIAVAFFFRQKTSNSALEVLRSDPENVQAIGRWGTGQLVSLVLAESVLLFGFALRFLGAPLLHSVPYYLVSLVLLLWFRPAEADF